MGLTHKQPSGHGSTHFDGMGFSLPTVHLEVMTRGTHLELATRGSNLARQQATQIKGLLEDRRMSVDLVEVETTGDDVQDELIHRLGTTGAFVRSLDEKVLAETLDGSVHSMKDMPTDQPEELIVAAVPERGPPADVLVTPDGTTLENLPAGATVGTSSLRRTAQLHACREDLEIVPLRGNVDTRVEKLLAPSLQREYDARLATVKEKESNQEAPTDREPVNDTDEYELTPTEWVDSRSPIEQAALEREFDTEFDAICLAEAGLDRSGLLGELGVSRLDPQTFVPAPAQGAIAVTARDNDVGAAIHDAIDHPPTRVVVTVERTILGTLGGGCVSPIGVFARLQGDVVTTTVRVLSRDGTEEVAETRELPVERHAEAAVEFAKELAAAGAAELIDRARREEPDQAKRG